MKAKSAGKTGMRIDLVRIRDEIAVLGDEIQRYEQKQIDTAAAIQTRQERKAGLEQFLVLASQYEIKPDSVKPEPARIAPPKTPPAPPKVPVDQKAAADRKPKTLVRAPSNVQTRMAQIIVRDYEPGAVFDLLAATDKLREFLPTDKKNVRPGQWIGTYMSRETAHTNGILELVSRGTYRVRPDAREILETALAASH